MTDSKVPPRSQSALGELWGLSINWAFPRPTSNDGQCNIVWGGTAIRRSQRCGGHAPAARCRHHSDRHSRLAYLSMNSIVCTSAAGVTLNRPV